MQSRSAAFAHVYPNIWNRWVWHKQPLDALTLSSPQHDGSPIQVARQVYHRMLCRIACAALWNRLLAWATIGLLFSFAGAILTLLHPQDLMSMTPAWPAWALAAVAFAVLAWILPGRLMAGILDAADQAEVAGVVRRALLRDIPPHTPPDLVDVWRHGWLTSEARPIAAELTEADARVDLAGQFAAFAAGAIAILALGIGSLAGSLVMAGTVPVLWFFFILIVRNPLVERGDELEAQEAVEGVAYSQAGGKAWGERFETARAVQLAEAARDTSPVVQLGTSTGLLAARGDVFAPSAGLPFSASLRDLQLHLVVFGGTGAGKTTGVLMPIAHAAAQWEGVGLVVLDGKGALPSELAELELDGFKVIDPAQERLSLIGGLDPQTIVETIVNIMVGSAGQNRENGNFWSDSAAGLLRRAAVIAEALGGRYWSLAGIADIAFNSEEQKAALEAVKALPKAKRDDPVLEEAGIYLALEWTGMDAKTRSNIEATARSWITTITAHGDLLRWAKATGPDSVDLMAPLTGGRLGFLLPAHRYGKAGAVVTALLKARIFARLKARAENPAWSKTETPLVMILDEAQEIATSEDATMLAIGRSLGLAVVAATQTIEGVVDRLGEDTAQKWLTIFGNACTLSGRSPGTDHFMSHRAGSGWRLMVDEVGGLSVRSAIDANVATGILAASMNQPSMAEAVDMAGSALVKTAWTRATKPIARVLQSIASGGAGGGGTITRIGPRPVVDPSELQSLLAEPDTALFLLTRGRVVRRDVVKLKPIRPDRTEKQESA